MCILCADVSFTAISNLELREDSAEESMEIHLFGMVWMRFGYYFGHLTQISHSFFGDSTDGIDKEYSLLRDVGYEGMGCERKGVDVDRYYGY